jgi:hypothetical protein
VRLGGIRRGSRKCRRVPLASRCVAFGHGFACGHGLADGAQLPASPVPYQTADETAGYLAIMVLFSATLLTYLSAVEVTTQLTEQP